MSRIFQSFFFDIIAYGTAKYFLKLFAKVTFAVSEFLLKKGNVIWKGERVSQSRKKFE